MKIALGINNIKDLKDLDIYDAGDVFYYDDKKYFVASFENGELIALPSDILENTKEEK